MSGLEGDATSPYRRDPGVRPRKVPSHPGAGNLTLRRGIVANDSKLLRWCEQPTTAERGNITIQLINESGAVTTTWTLLNACPVKASLTDGTGGERAVEAIELTFESMTESS